MKVIAPKHSEILIIGEGHKDCFTFLKMGSGITAKAMVEASKFNSDCTSYSSKG